MRVTDNIRFQIYAGNLSNLKQQLDRASQEVSSEKRVIAPSDDPAAYAKNLQVTAELNQNTQYASNLNSLQTQGAYYETALNSAGDLLTAMKQLAVQMASATADADSRRSAADQVDQVINQLVALGNTKVGDTYIFGGKKSDTPPYALNNATGTVTFSGTTDVARVAVGSSTIVNAGVSGNSVFAGTAGGQSVDIFATLKQFRDDLANDDVTGIGTDLNNIGDCIDLTSDAMAYVGTYTANISSLLSTNKLNGTNLTVESGNLVKADMAKAISDYTTISTAYQAALYTMAKVESLNILDYLPANL
jgi:flagellar hook-associated protein 3 FlgL